MLSSHQQDADVDYSDSDYSGYSEPETEQPKAEDVDRAMDMMFQASGSPRGAAARAAIEREMLCCPQAVIADDGPRTPARRCGECGGPDMRLLGRTSSFVCHAGALDEFLVDMGAEHEPILSAHHAARWDARFPRGTWPPKGLVDRSPERTPSPKR